MKDELQHYLKRKEPVVVLGPLGCGKSHAIRETINDIGYDVEVVEFDLASVEPNQKEKLVQAVRTPGFLKEVIYHIPNIDNEDKQLLARVAKKAQESEACGLVMESTAYAERKLGALKSYVHVIKMKRPHISKLRKIADEHGHSNDPRNYHEAVSGSVNMQKSSDFNMVREFFDGTNKAEITPQNVQWILHNAPKFLKAYDVFLLMRLLSGLAVSNALDLAGDARFKGSNRKVEFPYYYRKKSLRRQHTK